MNTIEIMFSRELYEEDAVRDAAQMFEDFAGISIRKDGNNLRMNIASRGGAPLQDMIIGEIMNFVLARTVELKAT
ncbi:MAG: HxsD-like protein [Pseudomonadota bacterium]